jgi:murein DD-endopeptidase MepM/ murein hydrolase activator NlpD
MRTFVVTVKTSAMIGLLGVLLAGCSSSIDRFADYPGKTGKTYTASTSRAGGSAASDDYIESSSLDSTPVRASGNNPYAASYKPPIYNRVQTSGQPPAYDQPSAYNQPPAYNEPSAYQPVQYQPQASYGEGSAVIVEPGQTLYSIARAHGMSVTQLAAVNGLHPPYYLHAGQRLKVLGSDEPRAEATYAPAQQNFSQKGKVHTVRSGETLFALGRRYGVHPYKIADFNGLPHDISLSTGQKIRIPGGKSAERIEGEETFDPPQQDAAAYDEEQDSERSNREQDENNTDIAYAPADEDRDVTRSDTEDEQTGAASAEESINNFRWPVKGRIISKYGSKPGGTRNEGINIAVPEGTSVRAAESGVIAYAGNELKGYGNLVLIRHEGGWVTAYAHNKQLYVKRGDTVRRGDVIAKAGQTGSVDAPQLHFELRKGATAVDPLKYLGSAQAANY